MSDATISKLLRENGIDAVPHGFRTSGRRTAVDRRLLGDTENCLGWLEAQIHALKRPDDRALEVRFGGRHRAARHAFGDGLSTIGDMCDTETNSVADMQAITAGAASASRRETVAAARLSELAAEARAGWDATTLERLIVKDLTRYYHGIDNAARRALAAAEPPLTGTVWDAVIAATVEHACTTHGAEVPAWTQAPERFLKRPWVFRRGPIERGTALANVPAAFIRHNTFIEPRNLDERGGERHVWADHESAAPRVVRPVEREAEAG